MAGNSLDQKFLEESDFWLVEIPRCQALDIQVILQSYLVFGGVSLEPQKAEIAGDVNGGSNMYSPGVWMSREGC